MEKILILLLVCIILDVNAAIDWKLVKDKNEIQIYTTQKLNHKLKHFKAQYHIKKNAKTILAALQDTSACSQWVHNCISNELVSVTNVRIRTYHTIIKSSLWLKD